MGFGSSLNTQSYTLQCNGGMTTEWMAGFLSRFKEHNVNIRQLEWLPDPVSPEKAYQLKLSFDLPLVQETPVVSHPFLRLVNLALDAIPDKRISTLQPV